MHMIILNERTIELFWEPYMSSINIWVVIFVMHLYITIMNPHVCSGEKDNVKLEEIGSYVMEGRMSVLNWGSMSPVPALLQEGCPRRSLCLDTGLGILLRHFESGAWLPGDGSSERQASLPKMNRPPKALISVDWRGVPEELWLPAWVTQLLGRGGAVSWKLSPWAMKMLKCYCFWLELEILTVKG